jgi:hypothetical protein
MFWKILPMNMSGDGPEFAISGDNQAKLTIDETGTVSADRFAGDGSSLSIGGSPLQAALSAKVNTAAFNTALAEKVDTAALNTSLAGKVDTAAFNTALAEKVDTAALNTALTGKVDTAALTTALAEKVDTAAFNTALAGKVDTAALTTALAEKVDKNAFNAAIGQKLDVTGGTISGNLTVGEVISANQYQGDGANLTGKVSTVGDTMTGPLTINSTLSVSGMLTATEITATGTVEANALKFGDGTTQTSAAASVWETSGNKTFYNNGNVGIGTPNPLDKLDLSGAMRFNGHPSQKISGESRGGHNAVVLKGHWNELEVKGRVIDWSGSNLHIGYGNDHSAHCIEIGRKVGFIRLLSGGGGAETMRITGGKVGIKNSNPGATLDVNGSFKAKSLSVNSGSVFSKIQAGSARVGNSSRNIKRNFSVKFPSSFVGTPHVIAMARGRNFKDTFAVTTTFVSRSSFSVNIKRLDAAGGWGQSLILDWFAWASPRILRPIRPVLKVTKR